MVLGTGWKRIFFYLTPLTCFLAQVFSVFYLYKRVVFTLHAQNELQSTYYAAWIFVGVEIVLSLTAFTQLFWQSFLLKTRERPAYRLIGDKDLPTVDVLVCTAGEPCDEVMDTVKAACDMVRPLLPSKARSEYLLKHASSQDYPLDCFRVFVCDDAGSDTLKAAVEAWQQTEAPHLIYQRRTKIKGVPHHAKAGNINAALERIKGMGPGEYVASFDADMIAERHFLRALLPHLILDSKMALAGSPQAFFNVPKGDPLNQDLANFFESVEPLKDAGGIAWCTGSGFIMRREALDAIGGFPYGTLAEDVCCSSLMLGQGWRTSFINERLQFGTVPESLAGHLKQRTRWTVGTIQSCIKLGWFLWGKDSRRLTLLQRLSGLTYGISSLFIVPFCASFIVFPYVFFSQGTLIPVLTTDQLKFLIWLLFAQTLFTRIHEVLSSLRGSWVAGRRETQQWVWQAPFAATAIVRTFLPKWLGGKAAGFTASGSIIAGLNERDAETRAGLFRRMRVMLIECKLWVHCVLFAVSLSSIVYSINVTLTAWHWHYFSRNDALVKLLVTVGWPPLFHVMQLSAYCIPILYVEFSFSFCRVLLD